MIELWKTVATYPHSIWYEVSSEGRVRRRGGLDCAGRNRQARMCKIHCTGQYMQVSLSSERERSYPLVHRLVAEAFIPNPANLPQVHHRNFDKSDNRLVNLEWVSARKNHDLSVSDCPKWYGENHYKARLTIEDVKAIRRRRANGDKIRTLADEFGVRNAAISAIVARRIWKSVD